MKKTIINIILVGLISLSLNCGNNIVNPKPESETAQEIIGIYTGYDVTKKTKLDRFHNEINSGELVELEYAITINNSFTPFEIVVTSNTDTLFSSNTRYNDFIDFEKFKINKTFNYPIEIYLIINGKNIIANISVITIEREQLL